MKLNIVPARTGILWVKLGIQTFLRQPLALAGLFFMFFMVFILLSAVPTIGPLLAMVLMPAATLGMMAASRQASEGRFPMPSVLLSAFQAGQLRGRAMLVLGTIYAAALLVLFFSVAPFMGPDAADPQGGTVDAALGRLSTGVFVYALLQLPLAVLFAHAPALVHWHGLGPAKSLFFSAVAFWRNLGAFAVFGVTWFVFLMGVSLALNLVLMLFGTVPTLEAMIPVCLLVMSIMSTSMYFTFRDIFVATPEEAPDLPASTPPHGEDP
ncbi:MAG TPA: BPSS1780 family membrane protein [Ramlibacter sp.]|uniref:BPSS1780 family membrane protein n=1 Tax=Ramlibacter sp. TaxID=1917967 RepID=UPI002C424A74|nr:BPSS1780 family membrane protein [Ramlibacter sp.]HVZ45873.1 BPSS1780 family membrane protein [Ramlibacter sp.]